MKLLTIANVAPLDKNYSSLEEKMTVFSNWINHAGRQGAKLIVLPEAINIYGEHTPTHPNAIPFEQCILTDWRKSCKTLIDSSSKMGVALVLPIIYQAGNGNIYNSFFLIDEKGQTAGEYQKQFPTPGELDWGIVPGKTELLRWSDITIGGAICFDTLFDETYKRQEGAQLLLCPSQWPGGCLLDFYARRMNMIVALSYPEWSRIINSDGKEIASGGYRSESRRFGFGSPIVMATVNFDRQNYYGNHNQEKMVDIENFYGEQVKITFDQPDCQWTIESLTPRLTIAQIELDFELINQQAYFKNCAELVKSQEKLLQ
jgi:hypothetical protein